MAAKNIHTLSDSLMSKKKTDNPFLPYTHTSMPFWHLKLDRACRWYKFKLQTGTFTFASSSERPNTEAGSEQSFSFAFIQMSSVIYNWNSRAERAEFIFRIAIASYLNRLISRPLVRGRCFSNDFAPMDSLKASFSLIKRRNVFPFCCLFGEIKRWARMEYGRTFFRGKTFIAAVWNGRKMLFVRRRKHDVICKNYKTCYLTRNGTT